MKKKINNYVLNYASTFCQHSLTKKQLNCATYCPKDEIYIFSMYFTRLELLFCERTFVCQSAGAMADLRSKVQ